MIELLSLPKRPNAKAVITNRATYKSGLPINSLPGWETIPLNLKLPMLKCPGNQVIFTKDKIGQSFKHLKQVFDPSGRDSLPEYNPLHDSNLKTFYANERNLKRLRLNGEITEDNDVICTLKDFNAHRLQMHKSHVYHLLQELNRLESEQRDRVMISNAEAITIRDQTKTKHTATEVIQRKLRHDQKRQLRFELLCRKTQDNLLRIAGLREMQKVMIDHKKMLNGLKMQHHCDAANDMLRKRQIFIKKLFQFKEERKAMNLIKLKESRIHKATEAQRASWEMRLEERIANQQKMNRLLAEAEKRRKVFIENHRSKYKEKWARIQDNIIRRRSILNKMSKIKLKSKKKRRTTKPTEERGLFCPEYQASFDQLLDDELCEAINATLDMDLNVKIPFNPDDPIYKAAKFIMQHIINKFDKDLNNDRIIFKNVNVRISKFFEEAKRFVIFRATQIIAAARDSVSKDHRNNPCGNGAHAAVLGVTRRSTLSKFVSFCKVSATIGTSSYAIHPDMDVRDVADRTPTPAGSLASIVVDSRERLVHKIKSSHMCRNEMVFVEHFLIKFKRELIVGLGKRVFTAIECHFEDKIMDVRNELLDIDREFLVCEATKAILGYARNPLNFESIVKLCTSALSNHIIFSLQKQLLRPKRDPRGIVPLQQSCSCNTDDMKLCLYCHE